VLSASAKRKLKGAFGFEVSMFTPVVEAAETLAAASTV
jgi:hypothetical protein